MDEPCTRLFVLFLKQGMLYLVLLILVGLVYILQAN